jgi:serine/threonine/tyrosine-interacting protein
MSLIDSVQVVQARRFSANIDDELKLILGSYNDVLEAQRMIADAPRVQTPGRNHSMASLSSPTKRGREVEIDSVMDDDDGARFQERSSFVPFSDAKM